VKITAAGSFGDMRYQDLVVIFGPWRGDGRPHSPTGN
jgi:hypothetical protein